MTVSILCNFCSALFVPKRNGNIYCSKLCREKGFHRNHPKKHKEYMVRYRLKKRCGCRVCNIELPYPSSGRKYCNNCFPQHRLLKLKRYRDIAQEEFSRYKESIGCKKCGYNKCGAALDYHHLDPAIKERRVTARMWKTGLGVLEINKCILICKNCHMEEHHC